MTLKEFLDYFPTVELPVTFSDEVIDVFSKNNKVLPALAIERFIGMWEESTDDMTEYIPCVQLPGEGDFHAIVFWKGALSRYDFILATLDKKGAIISKKIIASTFFDHEGVKRSVASIDEDLIIHIVAGVSEDGKNYNPENSKAFNMEIIPTGDILFSLGEE
jgi:hypothetical protein